MAGRQPTLFDELQGDDLAPDQIDYAPMHVSKSTFKAGLAAKVHRWFRLTPSFGPDLVRHMLRHMHAEPSDVILDPFAGASTTLIEGRLERRSCFGYEINPLLHFVGRVSLDWSIEHALLCTQFDAIEQQFSELASRYDSTPLEALPFDPPTIHNATRWWRPDVLRDLVLLREAIDIVACNQSVRDFFRLSLAGVLVPDLTNVTLGRLQLHFIDRSDDDIAVWRSFAAHTRSMLDDYQSLSELADAPQATLILGDSVRFNPAPPAGTLFDIVITSPPYPNRYSYVWNTRPHLYMLGMFSGKREASDLDKRTIGGTWGTATSILKDGMLAPYNDAVEQAICPVADEIRQTDNLMANYCLKYFNCLAEHLTNLRPYLRDGARLSYIVGCSRLKGVYVETDLLLKSLVNAMDLGITVDQITRFRKRHSGKDLYESAVFMRA